MSTQVSDLGLVKPGSVWDRIRGDSRLAHALRVLSLREIDIIAHHARSGPIAADHELTEVLKALRPCVEGYIDRCDYTKGNQALAMLDAAIAKAEGR